ncbi:hypothetical protein [Methanobrevibacter sp.]|uniref:hypothetical protein n=1 Tax=Methanobrevibacter sp. TaxID=66852 RepID=UPI00388F0019
MKLDKSNFTYHCVHCNQFIITKEYFDEISKDIQESFIVELKCPLCGMISRCFDKCNARWSTEPTTPKIKIINFIDLKRGIR